MTPLQLKAIRQSLGLSQTKLAERLQVSTNTVWRWESGFTPINYVTALAILHLECVPRIEQAGIAEEVDYEQTRIDNWSCSDCKPAMFKADND